jgi:hypothetical protein
MRARSLALAVSALAGCGEPVIEMTLRLPEPDVQAEFDTSCLTTFEIYIDGNGYPDDPNDYRRDCLGIDQSTPKASIADIYDEVRGQFALTLPASGLAAVEVYARTGTCDQGTQDPNELIYHAGKEYDGGDTISVPLVPVTSCEKQTIRARPIDVLQLVTTKDCAMSGLATGGVDLATMTPLPLTDRLTYYGGVASAPLVDGVATLQGSLESGPTSCVALYAYDDLQASTTESTACYHTAPGACAGPGEVEVATINREAAANTPDPQVMAAYNGVTYGLVWGTQPLAGAEVTLAEEDSRRAQVLYLDPPPGYDPTSGAPIPRRVDGTTGPSGMFMVYTKQIVTINVTANGTTRTLRIGTFSNEYPGAVIVGM